MKKLKKLDEKVLAHGEATGHAHRVTVDVYEDENKIKYFEGKTSLTHEEHKRIDIPCGEWVSGQIREYDHFSEEARVVRD